MFKRGLSDEDVRHVLATGKTIDAALRRVQVAIQLHLRGMREDGLRPPRPRPDRGSASAAPADCASRAMQVEGINEKRPNRRALVRQQEPGLEGTRQGGCTV